MKINFRIILSLMFLQGLSMQAAGQAGAACTKAPTSTKQTIKKRVMVAFTEADVKLKDPCTSQASAREKERVESFLNESIPDEIASTP